MTGYYAESIGSASSRRPVSSEVARQMFHIEREIHDFVVLTRVFGEIDLNVVDDVRSALSTALALTTEPFPLVIDLSGVTFLSSAGLNELVTVDRMARERDIELRLVADRREVLRPLDLTGLRNQFDIRATLSDALATSAEAQRN